MEKREREGREDKRNRKRGGGLREKRGQREKKESKKTEERHVNSARSQLEGVVIVAE